MLEHAKWIGVPHSEIEKWNILEGDMTGRFAYFRSDLALEKLGTLKLQITANARYRLWINEKAVCSGPCKGDHWRQYCDEIDVTEYLKTGKNVFAVQVLYLNEYESTNYTQERAAIYGIIAMPDRHRLAVKGEILDADGAVLGTVTTGQADWKVYLEGSYFLKSAKVTELLGGVCEELNCGQAKLNWKKTDFAAEAWPAAEVIETVENPVFWERVGFAPRYQIEERPIPMLAEYDSLFADDVLVGDYAPLCTLEGGADTVPAGVRRTYIADAGKEVNGYPSFVFEYGKDAKVQITYFEKFQESEESYARSDAEHGVIVGITDQMILDGTEAVFEPFWYRTFRYIRIIVEAAGEDVKVHAPKYRRTHYPLAVTTKLQSSALWVKPVWDMCLRTLKNCMMETYMDCPYYEQLQYPMDTRLQVLFNYAVSRDTRLAKKALTDYHHSMTPMGLILGRYPSCYRQIISTFSLYYIYMMEEYYMQTADAAFIKELLPDADRILAYYERKITEDGLLGRIGYWEFVDWQPSWNDCSGVPRAALHGPSTIINFMYAYALKSAAHLAAVIGREGLAREYESRRQTIVTLLTEQCWDENRRMFREGPQFEEYTQHAQAWAVLNEAGTLQQRTDALLQAAKCDDVLKVTFAASYEWFRALQITGLYELSETNMKRWIELADSGHTTCPETPDDPRSECHAWSALPLYEMVRSMAGVKPQGAGETSVVIQPYLLSLEDLRGECETGYGVLSFDYKKENGIWRYEVTMPKQLQGQFILPDGTVHELKAGEINLF